MTVFFIRKHLKLKLRGKLLIAFLVASMATRYINPLSIGTYVISAAKLGLADLFCGIPMIPRPWPWISSAESPRQATMLFSPAIPIPLPISARSISCRNSRTGHGLKPGKKRAAGIFSNAATRGQKSCCHP